MSLKLKCIECKEDYICFIDNTRIYGPIIETTCPHCKEHVVRNLSKFVEIQLEKYDSYRIIRAIAMQRLAREICKLVSDDDPSKYKKKKKRKM